MLITAAMLLLVSCGGGDDEGGDATAAPTSDGGNAATAVATSDGGSGSDGSGGSGGGSGAASGDVDQWVSDLTPPNGNEMARFTAPDGITVSFESDDSVDDLKSYYDDKLGDLGITVQGTADVGGTHTWVIGDESGDGVQGGLTVSESGDGKSLVTITLTTSG